MRQGSAGTSFASCSAAETPHSSLAIRNGNKPMTDLKTRSTTDTSEERNTCRDPHLDDYPDTVWNTFLSKRSCSPTGQSSLGEMPLRLLSEHGGSPIIAVFLHAQMVV